MISEKLSIKKSLGPDSTVQEKNITYPTDSKLAKKIIAKCKKIAEEYSLPLRQSYTRRLKKLYRDQRFRNHPKNKKKALRADKKLKTIAGRLVRELERNLKTKEMFERFKKTIELFKDILAQKRDSKKKYYSLHEPEVECISKGKEHKKYEFGNKVSIVRTAGGLIIGAKSFRNEYDGHTIDAVSTISIKRGVLKLVEKDRWIVIESSTGKEFKVAHRKNAPGNDGQTISFTLYPHPKEKHSYLAKVEEHSMSPEITWKEVKDEFMKSSNLPESFSQEIEEFAASKKSPTAKDFKGRVDYRGLTILCIDPEGARDHDDAVSVERLPGGGFKLGVHIADVSYYVPEGSALDEEALNRSYTQYLPWCAVPMLPERLSGDLCSLHEGVDRCAFTCMMVLNKKGEVQSYEFHRSVINVTSSISYERALEMKNEGNTAVADLALVSKLLKENRAKSGILELGGTEYQCLFDEKNEPVQIVPRKNDESNSWIEECMLIANNCCAKELVRRQLQGIFRIHEAPDTKDIMELYYLYPDLFKDSPVELRDLGKPRRGDSKCIRGSNDAV